MLKQHILTIINDLVLTIGAENRLLPMLTRVLQRFLFHTGHPVGIAFSQPVNERDKIHAQLLVAIGDRCLKEQVNHSFQLPEKLIITNQITTLSPTQITTIFSNTSRHYHYALCLPLGGQGFIILMSPIMPDTELPFNEIFKPILAHLKQSIYLCRQNEDFQNQLLQEKLMIQAELEQTYAQIQNEQLFLKNLKNTIPDLLWTKDLNGRYISCNASFEAFFGAKEADIIGKTDFDFVSSDLAIFFREHDVKAIYAKTPQTNEEWVTYPNGQSVLLETRKSPISDANGQLMGVVGIARDITETRKIQNSLNERRQIYSSIVEQSDDAICLVDISNGFFLEFNSATHEQLGYTREEFEHLTVADFDSHYQKELLNIQLNELAQHGSYHFESTLTCKDRRQIRVMVRAKQLMFRNRQCIAAIWTDITAQKQIEKKLLQLSSAVEQSPGSIVITDLEGKIEYVNQAFVDTTGWSREEAIGQNPRVLKSNRTPASRYVEMWSKLQRGETWCGEFINQKKNGEQYYELARIAPIRQSDGTITHYLAIKEDISRLKMIQHELEMHRDHLEVLVAQRSDEITQLNRELQKRIEDVEAANHAKSLFLANMSHEIRTPMNAIIALSQLAHEQAATAQQQDYLQKIRNASQHLLAIVNDILDFSKIEANKLTIEHNSFSLSQVLQDVTDFSQSRLTSSKLSWQVTVAADIPDLLIGDALRLKQILLNYAGNAIKFTQHGSIHLDISCKEQSETQIRLLFQMHDTGIGLKSFQIENLFQSFSQADNSTTRKYGGTGLGLAISSRLAGLMNGSVGVQSEYNQGSTFWVEIPFEIASNKTFNYVCSDKNYSIPESVPTLTKEQQEQLLKQIQQLKPLLAENDLEAGAIFRDIRSEMIPLMDHWIHPLATAISQCDFEHAIAIIRQIEELYPDHSRNREMDA